MPVSRQSWTYARIHVGAGVKVRPKTSGLADDISDKAAEDWGEDQVLTSHMGVAYASGLSKNGSWDRPDAVVPVMKVSRY